ncbi:NUDIX domain-containing protein [Alicyclobacillus cycloheptanicus]|nr:NUDIX domain-containing protein [Alicyclobacillus cycloheptanicus]
MLNRNRPANMGLWNGVGGKLEPGEDPLTGVLREVYEETGIALAHARFAGTVTWRGTWHGHDQAEGGMYAFLAEVTERERGPRLQETREGVLMWKPLSWILDPDNLGVAEHVSRFLARMLNDPVCYEHRCVFHDDRLIDYEPVPLPNDFLTQVGLSQVKTSSGSANNRP